MSAWKLRDAIVKNIPLTFRKNITTTKIDEYQQQIQESSHSSYKSLHPNQYDGKEKSTRIRLKAADRHKRDQKVTKALLALIKEDSNIQYWKITERLANMGYSMSPSSVCQKLKSLGIHRRCKNGSDTKKKSSLDALKLSNVTATSDDIDGGDSNDDEDNNDEDGGDDKTILLSGAHFLRSTFSD